MSAHTASLKDFFDMVVSGKTDNDQMALASLGVNKKNNKFIQLDGNLSTPVNTGAEQYCHRGWMLTDNYLNDKNYGNNNRFFSMAFMYRFE